MDITCCPVIIGAVNDESLLYLNNLKRSVV